MADPERNHTASCGCGQLRITLRGEPDVVVACSCTQCQRRTGSPFGVGAYYRHGRIVSIEGEATMFDRGTDSGRRLSNKFCPGCGTSVYWTLDMRPDHVGVAVGCFADPLFFRPERAVWDEHRHAWVTFPPDMPTYPKATP